MGIAQPVVVLDRAAETPLAAQLADALRAAARSGRLRVGERVPATRTLAADLGVSRTVTAAAYDQLVAEGWLGGRTGSGTYVLAAPPGVPGRAPGASGESAPDPVGDTVDPEADLRPGTPCLEVLDRAAWRRAWRRAGDRPPAFRPEPAGVPAFRAAVADLLLRHRGLRPHPDGVLATSGTTDALTEVLAVLRARAGRPLRVAVEDPGYRRAVGVARAHGDRVVGVAVDGEGLCVEAVPEGVDVVFTTPAHQYPLGARFSVARRGALVDRARAEGFLVVEDDYDGELRYDVAPLPLLASLGPEVVVLLGTTSKILSPTLGAGWAVAPHALAAAMLERRRAGSVRPAPAGQHVVAAMHADGTLGRHLARLRRELAARRGEVVAAVHGAGHAVRGDRAGAHLVVPLPDAASEDRVVTAAAAGGVVIDGLGTHHLDPGAPRAHHGVLVGWAAPSRAGLGVALDVLRRSLGEERRPPA